MKCGARALAAAACTSRRKAYEPYEYTLDRTEASERGSDSVARRDSDCDRERASTVVTLYLLGVYSIGTYCYLRFGFLLALSLSVTVTVSLTGKSQDTLALA